MALWCKGDGFVLIRKKSDEVILESAVDVAAFNHHIESRMLCLQSNGEGAVAVLFNIFESYPAFLDI